MRKHIWRDNYNSNDQVKGRLERITVWIQRENNGYENLRDGMGRARHNLICWR